MFSFSSASTPDYMWVFMPEPFQRKHEGTTRPGSPGSSCSPTTAGGRVDGCWSPCGLVMIWPPVQGVTPTPARSSSRPQQPWLEEEASCLHCDFLHLRSPQGAFLHVFECLCRSASVFWWSVYPGSSLRAGTSRRRANALPFFFPLSFFTQMANTAALSITIIYIKSEINFTLFSLSNYVNSCCEKQSSAHEF